MCIRSLLCNNTVLCARSDGLSDGLSDPVITFVCKQELGVVKVMQTMLLKTLIRTVVIYNLNDTFKYSLQVRCEKSLIYVIWSLAY